MVVVWMSKTTIPPTRTFSFIDSDCTFLKIYSVGCIVECIILTCIQSLKMAVECSLQWLFPIGLNYVIKFRYFVQKRKKWSRKLFSFLLWGWGVVRDRGWGFWPHSVKTTLFQVKGLNPPEKVIFLHPAPHVYVFDKIDNGGFFTNSYSFLPGKISSLRQ